VCVCARACPNASISLMHLSVCMRTSLSADACANIHELLRMRNRHMTSSSTIMKYKNICNV
jgi:hypothetical protein